MFIAKRVQRSDYAIRDPEISKLARVLERGGKTVIRLNTGDPPAYGFQTPGYIEHALVAAVSDTTNNGYADEQGEETLREAVAEYSRGRGIRGATAGNVVIGNGVSELIDYLFGVLVEEGRNVVLPKPDYPLYTTKARWYGGEPRYYELDASRGWRSKVEQIEDAIDGNTAFVLAINPNNPTGAVLDKAGLEELVGVVGHKGKGKVPILSDEVYHPLAFDGGHIATASLTDVPVVTLDGMSKAFYVPGWRCGYALLSNFPDQTLLDALVKVCSFRLSANNPVQHAYAAGLVSRGQHAEEFNRLLMTLKERTDYTTQRLESIQGISCVPPRGAFYAFPRVEEGYWDSDKQFVKDLLTEAGLWVVHGSGFGMDPRENYFRIVTLPELGTQEEAFDRLQRFMRRRKG